MKRVFFAANVWPSIAIFWILLAGLELDLVYCTALSLVYAALYFLLAFESKETSKLDYAVMLYFSVGLALTLINEPLGRTVLEKNATFFLFMSLFIAAAGPLMFGAEPFTMTFAKRKTLEVFWTTDLFIKINVIMTLVWAALFMFGALFSLLPGGIWTHVVIPLALIPIIGFPFTKKFPDWYQKRAGIGRATTSAPATSPTPEKSAATDTPVPSGQTIIFPEDSDDKRRALMQDRNQIRKVLVFQGSPRGKTGYTERCLQRFLEGIRQEGVEPEVIYLHKLKIRSCQGCFDCWLKAPGVCRHKDDMPALLEKINRADLEVDAFPLYVYSVPGIAKNFLDRKLPLLEPFIVESRDGLSSHPFRSGSPPVRLLLSVCGFSEIEHFRALVEMYRATTRGMATGLVGLLLRPSSESLAFGEQFGPPYQISMQGLKAAGREVIQQGYVSRDTELAVSTPFFRDPMAFHQVANVQWQARIEYEAARKRGEKLPTLADYINGRPDFLFAGMASIYDAEKGGDFSGIIQFHITGDQAGWYYLWFKEGRCSFGEGKAENPGVTIHTPWDVWQAISSGEISGQEAMMQGKYTVEGDLGLLMRMGQIFGR